MIDEQTDEHKEPTLLERVAEQLGADNRGALFTVRPDEHLLVSCRGCVRQWAFAAQSLEAEPQRALALESSVSAVLAAHEHQGTQSRPETAAAAPEPPATPREGKDVRVTYQGDEGDEGQGPRSTRSPSSKKKGQS